MQKVYKVWFKVTESSKTSTFTGKLMGAKRLFSTLSPEDPVILHVTRSGIRMEPMAFVAKMFCKQPDIYDLKD